MILAQVASRVIPQALFNLDEQVEWFTPSSHGGLCQNGTIIGLHLNIYEDEITWDYTIRITQVKLSGEIISGLTQDEEIIAERELIQSSR